MTDFFWVFLSQEVEGRFCAVEDDFYLRYHRDFTFLDGKLSSLISSTIDRLCTFFVLFIRSVQVNENRPSINFENRTWLSNQSDRLVNIQRSESKNFARQLDYIVTGSIENFLLKPHT
jgi:hypothetical protein